MVLGGCTDQATVLNDLEYLGRLFISYVTPISLIMSRIKTVTGREVELIKVDLNSVPNIILGGSEYDNEEEELESDPVNKDDDVDGRVAVTAGTGISSLSL